MSPLALSIRFLQTQPDRRLVELACAGHERAFEALVQRYRRPLLAYARRLADSDAGAEDALQQALLQAWIALGNSNTEVRDARAWLYRIVHNVAVSNLRRPAGHSVPAAPPEEASGADHEVEQRIAVRQALSGLASLPDLQRRVMLSTALEGCSHDEIAVALGLSHGAVRGLIYRARATLRAAAAVVVPSPMINWIARQDVSGGGRSMALYEAIAGSGSAGLGGLLLKGGGLVATAGAFATAAGVTVTSSHETQRAHPSSALYQAGGAAGHVRAATTNAGGVRVSTLTGASGATTAATGSGRAAASGFVWRAAGHRGGRGKDGSAQHMTAIGPAGSHRGSGSGGSGGKGSGGGSEGGSKSAGSGGQSGGDHGGGGDGKQLVAGTAGGTSPGGTGGHGDGGSGGSGGSGSDGGSGGSGGGGDHSSGAVSGSDNGGTATVNTASASTTASTPTVTTPTPNLGDGSDGGGHGD